MFSITLNDNLKLIMSLIKILYVPTTKFQKQRAKLNFIKQFKLGTIIVYQYIFKEKKKINSSTDSCLKKKIVVSNKLL